MCQFDECARERMKGKGLRPLVLKHTPGFTGRSPLPFNPLLHLMVNHEAARPAFFPTCVDGGFKRGALGENVIRVVVGFNNCCDAPTAHVAGRISGPLDDGRIAVRK